MSGSISGAELQFVLTQAADSPGDRPGKPWKWENPWRKPLENPTREGRSGDIFQDFGLVGIVGIVGIEKAYYLEFRDKSELGMGQKSRVLLKLGMARIKHMQNISGLQWAETWTGLQ